MSNFVYDPSLIRELAEGLVFQAAPSRTPWERKRVADIELYAEEYARYDLDEIREYWESNTELDFDSLTNDQVHSLLAHVAMWHSSADWDLISDYFMARARFVFEDEVKNNPEMVIGGKK